VSGIGIYTEQHSNIKIKQELQLLLW